MPIVLGGSQSNDRILAETGCVGSCRPQPGRGIGSTRVVEIGLINNMADAALEATERQFINLLGAAADKLVVRLRFFSIAEIPRGEAARSRLQSTYIPIGKLTEARLDALIVTGAEPRATSLDHEPYWDSLAQIVDWAEHNTISTIWSCLAAHAAVLHLDGVQRHELERKRLGVFECDKVSEDPMLSGASLPLAIAHSRWNELHEAELVSHGYRVLTRSPQAGVDMFVKQWRSLFVFFQGHPEYNLDSLQREYRRDMNRFLRNESATCPPLPQGYFDRRSELSLNAFAARAKGDRHPKLLESFPDDLRIRSGLIALWQTSVVTVMRNWLSYLAAHKV